MKNKFDWKYLLNCVLTISGVTIGTIIAFIASIASIFVNISNLTPCICSSIIIIIFSLIVSSLIIYFFLNFSKAKTKDLIPYIIEKREMSKKYLDNNVIDLEIIDTIKIEREFQCLIPVSIVLAKTSDFSENYKSGISIIRTRKTEKFITLTEQDYTIDFEDENKENICEIIINIAKMQVGDTYQITVKKSIELKDAKNVVYNVASTINSVVIKELILNWEFPKNAEINVGIKVLNKNIYRNNGKERICFEVKKERNRITRKNRIKEKDKEGSITIPNPIYGMTYKIIGNKIEGERYYDIC